MGFGEESKRDSRRRTNGIRGGGSMGFVAKSKWDSRRRANGIRGKHQKSEGSTTGGGSLRCPVLGGADGGSTPVPECFISLHPSILSCYTQASYLVSPECFISFQPSVSSCCTRVFHLVSTECFILFHPSVSSCCTRRTDER